MATKQGRKNVDWGFISRGAIEAATPKAIVEAGAPQAIIEKIGIDDFLAALTPAQRRELAKRIEAGKKGRES